MTEPVEYRVILFPSVHHVMKAEKLLRVAGIPYKLVPVPKYISTDCGVCLRVTADAVAGSLTCLADAFPAPRVEAVKKNR